MVLPHAWIKVKEHVSETTCPRMHVCDHPNSKAWLQYYCGQCPEIESRDSTSHRTMRFHCGDSCDEPEEHEGSMYSLAE